MSSNILLKTYTNTAISMHQTSIRKCCKNFNNFDCIDCKIIVLDMKKKVVFAPYQTRLVNFESSLLRFFSSSRKSSFLKECWRIELRIYEKNLKRKKLDFH
jgi:hypothetical protein